MTNLAALSGWSDLATIDTGRGLIGIPCSLYRGGTSKGPVFLASDLPSDPTLRNRLLLAALNPAHPGQIDGIGGAETLSNKVAIVSPSERDDADVEYKFIQLTPRSTVVSDDCGTSGNMAAAIGPFALENGLVAASPTETQVRIFAVDSRMHIVANVRSPGGQVTYQGETAIAGVAGTAAPIILTYCPPFGNLTNTKLATPTGNRCDVIQGLPTTVIDAAGTIVMIFRAESVGRTGYEAKANLDLDESLAARVEPIRREIGQMLGLKDVANNEALGAIMIAPPRGTGSIASRKLSTLPGSPARCHAAHSGSGAICLAIAAVLPGTVAFDIAKPHGTESHPEVLIEHPSGTMAVGLEVTEAGSVAGASLVRTSRKLFSGQLYVPIAALQEGTA